MSDENTSDPVELRSRPVDDEQRLPGLAVSGIASLAAGAIHAGAIGIHAEHPPLARLFVLVAVFQLGYGLIALLRPSRALALAGAIGNAVIVGGWVVTRVTGISWIGGLEEAESPQFTDTVCAVFGLVASGAALAAVLVGKRSLPHVKLAIPTLVAAALAIPAMITGANHVHAEGDHGHETASAADGHDESVPHGHDESATDGTSTAADTTDGTPADDGHGHPHDTGAPDEGSAPTDSDTGDDGHAHDATGSETGDDGHAHDATDDPASEWPRPYDPAEPFDMSGVDGVTPKQQARAEAILAESNEVLPVKFGTTAQAEALGFVSIGDSRTGWEHFINYGYIGDDNFMDPQHPESLVYKVGEDGSRTIASAMYIAARQPIDSPEIVDYGGSLMQWHVHEDLCWTLDENGTPKVVGVLGDDGTCPPGSVNAGGGNPMVHVWVSPHECGPFAALEGHGAGQVADGTQSRADQCAHGHGGSDGHGDDHAVTDPQPYDPDLPIDLGGMEGVTPEQQAKAENLIAVTLYRLPQFADPAVAEEHGFRSIHDGATGYEHYVNWEYINDDKMLDPDYPESLVYTPQPDGTKKLVSAMYMLPDGYTLENVPDVGGGLTQWHIHNNLCFNASPEDTDGDVFVVGLTNAEGTCSFGVKLQENPMLHVWIVPHTCGPFAALEGVGAGQILEGEERLCDTAHGSH